MAAPIPSLRPNPDPTGWSERELDSQILCLADAAVLVMARASPGIQAVCQALSAHEFVPLHVDDVQKAASFGFEPRFVLAQASLPGALDYLSRTEHAERPRFAVALLDEHEPETAALRAGCALALRPPWQPDDVAFVLERMRRTNERWTAARETLERERTTVSVPVVEAVCAALQHELRNPLAAAISNLECLHEELRAEDERRVVASEIHGSLRRMAAVLDVVSSLVDGRTLEVGPLSLGRVAAAAVSAMSPSVRVSIHCEDDVIGCGNAELLQRALMTLLQHSIDSTADGCPPEVGIRIYATETEARISLRDDVRPSAAQPMSRAFEPVIRLGGDARSGLSLTLVRHAVARMGGTITLSREPRGRVFRIRLRRA